MKVHHSRPFWDGVQWVAPGALGTVESAAVSTSLRGKRVRYLGKLNGYDWFERTEGGPEFCYLPEWVVFDAEGTS